MGSVPPPATPSSITSFGRRTDGDADGNVFPLERMGDSRRPMALVLHEVPKCALPSDVLRALRDSGAVDGDYPLSNSTSAHRFHLEAEFLKA